MRKLMYNIGDKYGHWTIVGTAEVRNKQTYVKVQCDCGTISEVSLTCLLRGKTTQCKEHILNIGQFLKDLYIKIILLIIK